MNRKDTVFIRGSSQRILRSESKSVLTPYQVIHTLRVKEVATSSIGGDEASMQPAG